MSQADVDKLSKDPDAREIAGQLVEYLQDLIRIPSYSGEEEEIAEYLMNWIQKQKGWNHNSDEIKDDIHNVYFEPTGSEEKPCPF